MRCKVAAPLLLLTALLSSCSAWFFSGEHWIDRTRPVVLLETTGGVEYGAATEFGVLSLGSTATDGPCRVHYFLGPTPVIESGALQPVSPRFVRAEIDLKTQMARALDHSPTADDDLWVMWTEDGTSVRTVAVDLARGKGLAGDLLRDPGTDLPGGATLLCRGPKGESMFAGLIAGIATVDAGPAAGRYYVFAGVDRVRELLAVPRKYPTDLAPKYRNDGISVMKPVDGQPAQQKPTTLQPTTLQPTTTPLPIPTPKPAGDGN
ncbi:MAG: hypothetical protein ACE37K_01045 [Planctomycetota bacterium]